jgi:glycosyltransferase involved in cell wall biosynthesis
LIGEAAIRTMNRKIKILIIAPTQDTILGGQAVQGSRLLEKLSQEPNIEVNMQSIAPQFLPRLQRIKYLRTLLRGVKYLYDITTKIPRYDIIHIFSAAHASFLLAPTPGVLIAKVFGKKTVLNYRSGQLEEHYANWHRTLRPTLGLFDKIVTPSNYLVDIFAGYGFEAQSIYNFIDVERFKFRARNPLRPVFFSNRLLEELYNIPCILRAFALIQEKYTDAKLIVASFGDQRENLENYAKELKLRNVEFVGKVNQQRMAELYNEVDIYLNSPNTDNMPGSILECYASGVPIVTTNAGGIPYILEHEKTGLMVEINDHEALAREAMRLLEDNDLAQKLIANGREAVAKFSWEKVRTKWLSIYEELLNTENPSNVIIIDKH